MKPSDIAGLVAEVESNQLRELRDTNARLQKKLNKQELAQENIFEAVQRAAKDSVNSLTFVPPSLPKKDNRAKGAETACAVLGDWQLGKKTPTYNSEVCEKRILKFADKIIELTDIQRADHPVKEIRVWCIGDLIEGELIFPGQGHEIDSSLFEQTLVNGPRILEGFLRKMLENFDRVKVSCVMGNHGRIGGRASKDMRPDNSGDRMLYWFVKTLFERMGEKRISFEIPKKDFYVIDQVGKERFLLFHGDQIKGGFAGFPWYGAGKKVMGWKTGAIQEDFDHAIMGHFHQNTTMTINQTILRCNGTPESYNAYAQEQLASMGRPSQRLLYVHPTRGVSAEYLVWLDQ